MEAANFFFDVTMCVVWRLVGTINPESGLSRLYQGNF
jgi:hypothetical protein